MMHHCDIAIVGAGMVGLTLANALADSGLAVALISREPLTQPLSEQPGLRVSAINAANQRALECAGVWQRMPAGRISAYTDMTVWDKDSFGRIAFSAAENGLESLGHIIENQVLTNAMAEHMLENGAVQVIEAGIEKILGGQQQTMLMLDNDTAVGCRLLVGADGANSLVRKVAGFPLTFRDYGHTAIVANIRTEAPHGAQARQVFTPDGPLALLPMADPHLCSIVWSQEHDKAKALMTLDDEAFSHALTATSNSVLGCLRVDSNRASFPLTMRYARQWVQNGMVILGDAAHTIHPLAGQGANLGMQDALVLAAHIRELNDAGKDFARLRYLRPFERARKADAVKMIAAMDGFKFLFAGNNPLKKLVRGAGLAITDTLPGVKSRLLAEAMGW